MSEDFGQMRVSYCYCHVFSNQWWEEILQIKVEPFQQRGFSFIQLISGAWFMGKPLRYVATMRQDGVLQGKRPLSPAAGGMRWSRCLLTGRVSGSSLSNWDTWINSIGTVCWLFVSSTGRNRCLKHLNFQAARMLNTYILFRNKSTSLEWIVAMFAFKCLNIKKLKLTKKVKVRKVQISKRSGYYY